MCKFSAHIYLIPNREKRQWFLISSQTGLHKEYKDVVLTVAAGDSTVLVVDRCPDEVKPWNFSRRCTQHGNTHDYPEVLQVSANTVIDHNIDGLLLYNYCNMIICLTWL